MKKALPIIFAVGSFFAVTIFIFGFLTFKHYSENLPDHEQLKDYNPMITSRLYAADGSLISEFSKEKRIFVPIKNIPQNLIDAFLAAEDSNFYEHSGIDPMAILRTSVRNFFTVLSGDGRVGGASTITQQVVKNFLLTQERTLKRKIKEAILAFRITQTFPKDKILELYLNEIYLGSGAYGVAAAAQVYFDKSIDELTLEEEALLATLPKAPSKLDPRKNIERAKERRDWVLERMFNEGFISKEKLEEAEAKEIILKTTQSGEEIKASFFSDSVKKELSTLYGSDGVFENGYAISTTLNPRLQNIAVKTLQNGIEAYDRKHGYRGALGKISVTDKWQEKLGKFKVKGLYKKSWKKAVVLSTNSNSATIGTENSDLGSIEFESVKWARKFIDVDRREDYPKKISEILTPGDIILVEKTDILGVFDLKQLPDVNGGFIALDPHTGRVLAMSGGYIDAPNQFNRATQAMRQPGSTMKTFGYIAALENGMTPATIVMDEEITLDQGDDLPPYSPTNYSGEFYGPTTLRIGLENSRNVTSVRMADQVGLDKIAEVVKKFGVNDNPKIIYSLVLGSTETTVLRLATSYAMMVNGGKKITPSMIEKIQDREGKTIYRRDKRDCSICVNNDEMPLIPDDKEEVTDSATAYQITHMLKGVVDRGTAASARVIGKIVGGKTGTTNSSYDSWFVGFSPDLVTAVYVGFDNPRSLGSEETGASIALPIFVNFMKEALEETHSTPFRVPSSVKFVKIDRKTGKYPTPETPKKHIFFESLKLTDKIDESSFDNPESGAGFSETPMDADPVGIY